MALVGIKRQEAAVMPIFNFNFLSLGRFRQFCLSSAESSNAYLTGTITLLLIMMMMTMMLKGKLCTNFTSIIFVGLPDFYK